MDVNRTQGILITNVNTGIVVHVEKEGAMAAEVIPSELAYDAKRRWIGQDESSIDLLRERFKQIISLKGELILRIVLLGLVTTIFFILAMTYMQVGVDWGYVFRPAARAVTRLQSPFSIEGYFNAPWSILPLIPLALLPENAGYALLILLNLTAFAYTARRLGAEFIVIPIFLLSPPVLHSLLNGNIDGLAVLGFVLPPQIGLFFIMIKPQMGIAVAVYWLIDTWRKAGYREVLRVFSPILAVSLVSFLLFGLWPLNFRAEAGLWWNASLWPLSIPVGIILILAAIRRQRREYAMVASPCLSPYVLFHAWSGALMAIVSNGPATIAAVFGLWAIVALRLGVG
jgi:hypothetical protein